MNSNLILGIVAFFLWSSFSTWYYVCQINNYCYESEQTITPKVEPATMMAKASQPTENDADTTKAAIEQPEPELPNINITEQGIYFKINSADFINPEYAKNFSNSLKPQIEGREIEINIIGSTCDLGGAEYNKYLGLQRAKAARAYLIKNDINASKTEVSSQGEIPSKIGSDEERQKNRKVSITIKSIDQ